MPRNRLLHCGPGNVVGPIPLAVLIAVAGKQKKEDVEITFSSHVGWDGVLVLSFSLGIAGFYITFLYTKAFQAYPRYPIYHQHSMGGGCRRENVFHQPY
jgi:hypothetical protein